MKEKLVPLDISDAIALIERQEREIAVLTAENSVLREQNSAMNASLVKLRLRNKNQKRATRAKTQLYDGLPPIYSGRDEI